MRPVHPDRAAGAAVLGALAVLGLLHIPAGLGVATWLASGAALATVLVLLRGGWGRPERAAALGPADLVTLSRSVLTCVVVGLAVQSLVAGSLGAQVPEWAVVLLAAPALGLDWVDGQVARRTGTETVRGARFDMEVDALLILALSVVVGTLLGWWVLAIGLARYVLAAAQAAWPALRGPVPSRWWRKAVAAVQGIVLVVAAADVLPRRAAVVLVAAALMLLLVSFGTEVVERRRLTGPPRAVSRGDRPAPAWRAAVVTGLAVVLLWLALAAPDGDRHLSPWLVARVPIEGMVLVVVVALLPERWVGRVATAFGVLAALVLALKVVNVGFTLVLDRRFDVIGDWFYFGAGVGVLADSVGRPAALAIVAFVLVALLGLLLLVPWASRRVGRLVRRHRGRSVWAATVLSAFAVTLSLAGLGPAPYDQSHALASAAVVVDEAVSVRADLRDHRVFAEAIADDPLTSVPADRLLRRLRGKDVLLVIVESYGRSAVEDSTMAPGVDAVLDDGTRRLNRAGYAARSAFLTSPTFGAASWLAHATLQSGLWVDSQRRYSQVLASDRLTLTRAFGEAGWRTVVAAPAIVDGWSEGERFYRFDQLYDASNVGYRGPAFGYAPMPDQFTLAHLHAAELGPPDRAPVFVEVDLVSSHHPWTPLPRPVPWRDVGDGSVFDGMPEQGDSLEEVFADPDRVRAAFGASIEYSLETLVSFLTTYADDDLVVLMLGDHQPHHYVSGADPGYDVPVSLIARDPAVLADIEGWGWSPGLNPAEDAPVWPMDDVRDRFLTAFTPER